VLDGAERFLVAAAGPQACVLGGEVDVFGAGRGHRGQAMLDALVQATTDREILAELAKGRLRAKIPALKEALEGRFDDLHAVWIGAILAHLRLPG
jgi:hypothetical protein